MNSSVGVVEPHFELRTNPPDSGTGDELWFVREDGAATPIPALWLRTRSNDPAERDLGTHQRLVNPHLFDQDVTFSEARLDGDDFGVLFSDGLRTTFSLANLSRELVLQDDCPTPLAWGRADWHSPEHPNGTLTSPVYDWRTLCQAGDEAHDHVFLRSLEDFIRFGFLIIKHTPTESKSILDIARRYGFPRETNFDVIFEVYSRPVSQDKRFSDDLAYRPVALSPHTDNPYRDPVPGIQLLQCLQNETTGGYSTLVDSLAVCAQLKQEDPEGYQLLVDTPLRFAYRSEGVELVYVCPVIEQNGKGEMVGVHFSPRLCDIPLLDVSTTKRLQSALARLSVLFEEPAYGLKFKLMPGEMMMFDNNRVLHGRTAFDPNEGHRQLQGCYIDRDNPRSHYRVLNRVLKRTQSR